MKLPKITLQWMRKKAACWSNKRLNKEFFNHKKEYTPQDFLLECQFKDLSISEYCNWIMKEIVFPAPMMGSKKDDIYWLYKGFKSNEIVNNEHVFKDDDKTKIATDSSCCSLETYTYAIFCLDIFEIGDWLK